MATFYLVNHAKFFLEVSLLAASVSMGNMAHASLLYRIQDLGQGFAEDINDSGQTSRTGVNSTNHNFVVHAINAFGQVTGWFETAPDSEYHAFVTNSNRQIIDLGTLGGAISSGTGINNIGQVVGWSDTTSLGNYHAFVTNINGSMTDLGTLGGDRSQAQDINNSGQVTGWAELVPNVGGDHAFRTDINGSMTDLGTLGGYEYSSRGNAINDSGQVTGASDTGNGSLHAFVTDTSGQMIDLGVLALGEGNSFSEGYDINNAGQVVGSSWNSSVGIQSAFVTDNDVMLDLNSLMVTGTTGWHLVIALGINNLGQIVGRGDREVTSYWCFSGTCQPYTSTESHAFLLTPATVPIPSAAWLFCFGLIGIASFNSTNAKINAFSFMRRKPFKSATRRTTQTFVSPFGRDKEPSPINYLTP